MALNPTVEQEALTLTFHNLAGLAALNVHRTSASENLQELDPVPVEDGKTTLEMPP